MRNSHECELLNKANKKAMEKNLVVNDEDLNCIYWGACVGSTCFKMNKDLLPVEHSAIDKFYGRLEKTVNNFGSNTNKDKK